MAAARAGSGSCPSCAAHPGIKKECMPKQCLIWRRLFVVRQGKAMGDDEAPPEICGGHPVQMARVTYPQLLKLALHGQEALIHKGGRLAIAHKRGLTNACSSYRSLLISSHLGKSIHRALRQNQQDIYTQYMHGQQVGGAAKDTGQLCGSHGPSPPKGLCRPRHIWKPGLSGSD